MRKLLGVFVWDEACGAVAELFWRLSILRKTTHQMPPVRQIRFLDRASRNIPTMPSELPFFVQYAFTHRNGSVLASERFDNVQCVAIVSILDVFENVMTTFTWDSIAFCHRTPP